VLTNIFDQNKFESLLVANWAHFINSSKLLAFVLQKVQENTERLSIICCASGKTKGSTISVSNFALHGQGFTIWVDFSTPLSPKRTAEGTIEMYLSFKGELTYNTIIGNIMES